MSTNNGTGFFDTFQPYKAAIGVPATAVAFGILDQDNAPDVATAGLSSGTLYTFTQQPSHKLLQTVNSPFLSSAPAILMRIGEIGN